MGRKLAFALTILLFSRLSFGMELVLKNLNARLKVEGVEGVNAYLYDADEVWAEFEVLMGRCDVDALALGVKLYKTGNATVAAWLSSALAGSMSTCPEKLLPMIKSVHEIRAFCSTADLRERPDANGAVEVRKRIERIKGFPELTRSKRWGMCLRAYQEIERGYEDVERGFRRQ